MTSTALNSGFSQPISPSLNGAKVFFIPGTNPSIEIIETLQSCIDTLSDDHFNDSVTKNNVKNLITLFTHDTSSQLVISFLGEIQQAIEGTSKDIGDIHFLQHVRICVPELSSFIDVLLDPRFYANKEAVKIEGESLFAAISKTDLRKSFEEQRYVNTTTKTTTEMVNNTAEDISQSLLSQDAEVKEKTIENTLLDEFKDIISRTIGELLPHIKDEQKLHIIKNLFRQCRFDIGQKIEGDTEYGYELFLHIPQTLAYFLDEDEARTPIVKKFKKVILAPCNQEYNTHCKLTYRVWPDSKIKSLPKSERQQKKSRTDFSLTKSLPPSNLLKTYSRFKIRSIPQPKQTGNTFLVSFPESYTEAEKVTIAKGIMQRRDTPTLCVSPDNNLDVIYDALNRKSHLIRNQENRTVITREVDAANLSALNSFTGNIYRNLKESQQASFENPFFELRKYCDCLVVTGADLFLSGKSKGTFKSLFSENNMHIIFVARSGNLDAVPQSYTNTLSKTEFPLRAALAFNTIEIPRKIAQNHHYLEQELYNILNTKRELFDTVDETVKNIVFPPEFYNSVSTIANKDTGLIKLLLSFTAEHCKSHPTHDAKNILFAILNHCTNHKLFTVPCNITLDELYQIVAANMLTEIQKNVPDACVGDLHVKNAVARYITQLCTTPHYMTPPLGPYTLKDIQTHLHDVGIHCTVAELTTYRKEPITSSEQKNFGILCATIHTQIVEKLMTGHIDSVLSPRPIDTIAGIR